MNTNTQAYEQWKNGELDAETALSELISNLDKVNDMLDPIQEAAKSIRNQLSEVVNALGDVVTIEGYGKLENTVPTTTITYDRRMLDNLVANLLKEGLPDIAARITNCRKESPRAGYFRITQQRQQPGQPED